MRSLIAPGSPSSRIIRSLAAPLLQSARESGQMLGWLQNGCPVPAPPIVKRKVFARYAKANAAWIETGTYHGDTTHWLGSHFRSVYSIEPCEPLYARAKDRFFNQNNVQLFQGASEDIFDGICELIEDRADVCFWLDGHVSEQGTYQGTMPTPILEELHVIQKHLFRWRRVILFIDDLRLFGGSPCQQDGYPALELLLEWGTRNGMKNLVEHDIMIMMREIF